MITMILGWYLRYQHGAGIVQFRIAFWYSAVEGVQTAGGCPTDWSILPFYIDVRFACAPLKQRWDPKYFPALEGSCMVRRGVAMYGSVDSDESASCNVHVGKMG